MMSLYSEEFITLLRKTRIQFSQNSQQFQLNLIFSIKTTWKIISSSSKIKLNRAIGKSNEVTLELDYVYMNMNMPRKMQIKFAYSEDNEIAFSRCFHRITRPSNKSSNFVVQHETHNEKSQ